MHSGTVEEQLGKTGLAVEAPDGPGLEALSVARHQQVAEPGVALGVGVGAHQAEEPVGERPPGAPRLLTVDHEVLAIAPGLGLEPGQVRPGVRLRPTLGPDLVAPGHGPQEAVLLLRCAEVEDRGGQQAHPIGRHPPRRPRRPVLLLEDQPLHQRRLPPPEPLRPRHHRPPRVKQNVLPRPMLLKPVRRVHRLQRRPRHILSQPSPRLLPELSLPRSKRQIHQRKTLGRP